MTKNNKNKSEVTETRIVAQNHKHTLFRTWGGKIITKQYIIKQMKKGYKFFDLKGAEIIWADYHRGTKTYFKTIGDKSIKNNLANIPEVDLKLSNVHHKQHLWSNWGRWWWLWIIVSILGIGIIIQSTFLGVFGYTINKQTSISLACDKFTLSQNQQATITAKINNPKNDSNWYIPTWSYVGDYINFYLDGTLYDPGLTEGLNVYFQGDESIVTVFYEEIAPPGSHVIVILTNNGISKLVDIALVSST